MQFLTNLAFVGLATAAAINSYPQPHGRARAVSATNGSSFTLSAVDLTSNTKTPLTIVESLASRRILRPASTGVAQLQFTYNTDSHRLENSAFGSSDPILANRTLTFGEFPEPADGLLVLNKDGYYVFADAADGAADGWSLCASELAGLFWSGSQDALANCTKVALQGQ